MKRKQIGQKLRFEVFERDNFICQYCGRTPQIDGVTLQVDHIISVKDGGENNIENLTTSCFDCNIGKGKKSSPKKTAHQIEEQIEKEKDLIRQLRYISKRNNKLNKLKKEAIQLKRDWIYKIIGTRFVEKIYLEIEKSTKKYPKEKIEEALNIILTKEIKDLNSWIKYYNGILKNISLPENLKFLFMFFHNYMQSPFSIGRYDWKIKQSYEGVKKIIEKYSKELIEDKKYQEVKKEVEKTLRDDYRESFNTSQETEDFLGEREFTVYKSGKSLNVLLSEAIILTVKK